MKLSTINEHLREYKKKCENFEYNNSDSWYRYGELLVIINKNKCYLLILKPKSVLCSWNKDLKVFRELYF